MNFPGSPVFNNGLNMFKLYLRYDFKLMHVRVHTYSAQCGYNDIHFSVHIDVCSTDQNLQGPYIYNIYII